MSLGPIEVFVLFALMIFWIAPVAILIAIANNKGRSKHFAWWGVGLGWLGLIIGAAILLTGPSGQRDA